VKGQYPYAIPLREINDMPPGRYYCKWADVDGWAVCGWRVKEAGVPVTGRDVATARFYGEDAEDQS